MALSRKIRRWTAMFGIVALLFTQMAVAAYACSGLADGNMTTHGSMQADEESPCADMGSGQDNLCLEHCQGSQTADSYFAPAVALVAIPVYRIDQPDQMAVFFQSTHQYAHALLARVTAPPLSVRNCCFRT
jgi:hypothetical protein